jgi:hypothetical protein
MKQLTLLLSILALLVLAACKSQTKSGVSDADSTVINEMADTLNTIEAVERQVNAVYAYWNDLREHYDEDWPSVDERFGTREWWRVRQDVAAIDRECECGGFFDFGDEGPLDAWTYDCYEGAVRADSIKVKMLAEGMAEVRFLIKDAVTIKGVPIRWLMQVEDGEWRVANIFFEKNNDLDIFLNMQAYMSENKSGIKADTTTENINLSDYAE